MTRKRAIRLLGAATAALGVGAVPPAHATPAAIQDNVVHVKNVPGSTGGHVVAEGNRLYVGAYGIGMRLFDITDLRNPVPLGQYFPGPSTSDGTNDPGVRADAVPDAAVLDGRHIVTLNGTNRAGSSQQTEFLDWTNPAAPQLLWRFRGPQGEAHNGDIVDSRKLWLPSGSGGNDMLRIYDLSPLLQTPPAAPVRLSASGNLRSMWQASPYRGTKPVGPSPAHIHDLEVYTDYNLLLRQQEWEDQNGDGTPDPTYARRDIALYAASQDYPLSVGAGTSAPNSAVYIVDITNPRQPVVINMVQGVPGHRYMHEVQLLEGDPRVMFTADEDLHNGCDAGGVYSWRLSDDLTKATYLDTWYNGGPKVDQANPASSSAGTPAPVCSAHVFSSNDSYVFVGSYNAGLQVIDFTNPADLKRAGQYIFPGANSWGALYHRGYVYVGDFGARGLDVFQFAANPAAKGLVKTGDPATRTASGITETTAACDPASPANGVDGLVVPIPADKRDGTHVIRAITSADPLSEVDVWFYKQNCELVEASGLYSDNGAMETGLIAEEAAFAVATLYTGTPNHVYVQIDPAF